MFGSYSLFNFDNMSGQGSAASAIATVERAKLSPKRKISGSLNWNKLGKGQDLYRGDYVVTDDFSEVDVKFDNDSSLKIPPNSLVKIDYIGNSIHLELIKGLVNLDLRNMKSKVFVKKDGKQYELDTANGRIEVRDNGDKLEFSSDKGKVNVSEVNKDGSKIGAVKVAKQIITFKYPEGRFIDPLLKSDVFIKVSGVEKAKIYDLSVFSKANVRLNTFKLKGEQLMAGHRYSYGATGEYRVKLSDKSFVKESKFVVKDLPVIVFDKSSVSEKRIVNAGAKVKYEWEQIKAHSYVTEIKKNGKILTKKLKRPFFTVSPNSNSVLNFRVKVDHKHAKWTKWQAQRLEIKTIYRKDDSLTKESLFLDAKEANQRKIAVSGEVSQDVVFELARDIDFKKVVYNFKRKNQNFAIIPPNARPGHYFWRMRESTKASRKSSAYPIKLYSYAVKLNSKNKTSFRVQRTKGRKIALRWKERLRGSEYKFVIKDLKGKELPLFDKNIKGNRVTFKMPKFGTYKVHLTAENNKDLLVPNEVFDLRVERETVKIDFAVKDVMLKRSHKLGLSKHIMKLPKLTNKNHKKLHVYIYSDKNGRKIVHRDSTSKNRIIWKTNRSGEYYYKLKVENHKGLISDFSAKKKVLFPISPFFVTNIRIPAGKKRFYKFPYIVKRGDNLATILRNYTKPSTVLSHKSPMIQQIIKRNTHIKNWGKLKRGKKINIFVSVDSLDKSFLYIYKNLFIVKG